MAGRQHPEGPAGSHPHDPRDRPTNGVPDEVLRQARAAFSQRTVGEVALLVFDSLIDDEAPAEDHRLRFEHPILTIDVHVSARSESTDLSVALHPALERRAELQFEGEPTPRAATVRDGGIRFDDVPHRLVRLWLSGSGDQPAIRTDWFRI